MTIFDRAAAMRQGFEALARLEPEGWTALMTDDVILEFPFAPEGIPGRMDGPEMVCKATRQLFSRVERFTWHDLAIYQADDPEIAFATARSEVIMRDGPPYRNRYCFVARFREGRIAYWAEYFNPAPVVASFFPPA